MSITRINSHAGMAEGRSKSISHAAVGRYADMFQPYIYHRVAGKDLFYNVTAREMKRYGWRKPHHRDVDESKYIVFSDCPGYMWRRAGLYVMTIEDARVLYPDDDHH